MLIKFKKASDVASSEITSPSVYLDRRRFLQTAAIAGALLCSLIYVPLAQTIFFDDPLEHSLPAHVYSYMFWFLFGSGVLSLLIGNACANIGRLPEAATE